MNIHDAVRYGPRPKGYKSKNTAKPPRQRDGLKTVGCSTKRGSMSSRLVAQSAYPGGKRLRRALAKLKARKEAYKPFSKPSGFKNTLPGSMNAN